MYLQQLACLQDVLNCKHTFYMGGACRPPNPPARLPPPPYVHASLVHVGCSIEGTAPLLLRYRCGMTWITIIAMITSGSRSVHVGSSVGAGVRLRVIRELHTEARRRTHYLPEEPTTQRH